jgi:LSD1 subclass zinc finger protein
MDIDLVNKPLTLKNVTKTYDFVTWFSAQEVGQVKCGSCEVLLIYPYGPSSVKCSSCHFVTEIVVCELLSCKYMDAYVF